MRRPTSSDHDFLAVPCDQCAEVSPTNWAGFCHHCYHFAGSPFWSLSSAAQRGVIKRVNQIEAERLRSRVVAIAGGSN